MEQYRSAQRRRVWGLEQYRSAQRRRVWGLEQHRSAQLRRVAQGSTERRHEVVKNTRSPKTTTTGMTTTYNHQHLDYVGAKLKQQPMMSLLITACISLNHPHHKPIDSIDVLHYLWWPPP